MQNVFSIGNKSTCPPADEFVLVDTSVILELIGYDNTTSRTIEVTDFLMKLGNNNNIIVTTIKTWEELNIIFEGKISKQMNLRRDKGPLFKQQDIFVTANEQINEVKRVLDSLPNVYTNPIGPVDNKTFEMARINREKYNLMWGDSTILAIAENNGISNILSLDADYARVNNGMQIYLDTRSYNKAKGYNNLNSI